MRGKKTNEMWTQQSKCNWHPENCHSNHKQLEGDVTNDLVHIMYHQIDSIDGTVLGKYFFFLFLSQLNSKDFLLKELEKEFSICTISQTQWKIPHSCISVTQVMRMVIFVFENMNMECVWYIVRSATYVLSCDLSNHYFSS